MEMLDVSWRVRFATLVGPPLIGLVVGAVLGGTTRVNRWTRVDLGRLDATVLPLGTSAFGVYVRLHL